MVIARKVNLVCIDENFKKLQCFGRTYYVGASSSESSTNVALELRELVQNLSYRPIPQVFILKIMVDNKSLLFEKIFATKSK